MTARTTCGVLVVDSRANLLIGQATASPRWDIPKGVAEPGESWPEAAARELREETGLLVQPTCLVPFGLHTYLPGKMLALFWWEPVAMPDPALLRCTSMFRSRDGRTLPEFARFAVLPWADALTKVGRNMARVLTEVGVPGPGHSAGAPNGSSARPLA